jgi:hypothetical protein
MKLLGNCKAHKILIQQGFNLLKTKNFLRQLRHTKSVNSLLFLAEFAEFAEEPIFSLCSLCSLRETGFFYLPARNNLVSQSIMKLQLITLRST